MMKASIRFILMLCLNSIVYTSLAMALPTTHPPQLLFVEGVLLLKQQHYRAAQKCWEDYLNSPGKHHHKETAAYYRVLAALGNKDPYVETLVQHFIIHYPNSPYIDTLRYRLAKLLAQEHVWHKCLLLYDKINLKNLLPHEQDAYPYERAEAYLARKEWSSAKENLAKIKDKTHPYYYPTQLRMAYIALEEKKYKQALVLLAEASQNNHYLPEVRSLTLQVYHSMRDFEALLAYAASFPKLPFIKQEMLLIGDAYFFLKQYAAAITHYQAYLTHTVKDRKTLTKLGYALYETQQYAQALHYFKQLLDQEDHESQVATYYSGLIQERKNATQEALSLFEKTSQQNFDPTLRELAYLKRAGLYYQEGAWQEVIQAMDRFIQENPKSTNLLTAQLLLLKCYYQTKAYTKAIAYLTALPYKNEAFLRLYQKVLFHQGIEAYNQGMLDNAIAYFKQSVHFSFKPSLVAQAQFWLAEASAGLGDYDKALKYYNQLMEQSSIHTLYHEKTLYGLAYAYFNTGNYKAATHTFQQYLNIAPKQPATTHYDVMLRLGDCQYVIKNYEQALTLYEGVYAYYPAHVRYQEALIYQVLGNQEEAEKCLQEVITNHSTTKYYIKACYQEACMAFNAGHYERAIQKFGTLLQKDPPADLKPDLLIKRALAYENLQKNQEACADYIAILDQFPTHTHAESALMALSNLFAARGTPEQIDSYLQKYKPIADALASHSDRHTLDTISKLFYSQAYHKVLQQLNTFYRKYPQSKLLPEAYFLMAESYYRLHKNSHAMQYYKKVVASSQASLHVKAWLRIADLTYQSKQFQEALTHYQKLQKMELTPRLYERVLMGIVKSSFLLKKQQTTIPTCLQLLNNTHTSTEVIQEARLYLGKVAMQQMEYKSAKSHFVKASIPLHTLIAAEAQYLLASTEFKLKNYNASLNALFTLIEKFPQHTHYLDQAFLLMADNYLQLGNFTQAKATLDSITRKSKNKKTIVLAKKKSNTISARLKENK